ncbi:hypothetical protein CVS40_10537 [Lucilia cuprina]|nr:hypothetical protein CVS40_10537 [Lucilia cuprina]
MYTLILTKCIPFTKGSHLTALHWLAPSKGHPGQTGHCRRARKLQEAIHSQSASSSVSELIPTLRLAVLPGPIQQMMCKVLKSIKRLSIGRLDGSVCFPVGRQFTVRPNVMKRKIALIFRSGYDKQPRKTPNSHSATPGCVNECDWRPGLAAGCFVTKPPTKGFGVVGKGRSASGEVILPVVGLTTSAAPKAPCLIHNQLKRLENFGAPVRMRTSSTRDVGIPLATSPYIGKRSSKTRCRSLPMYPKSFPQAQNTPEGLLFIRRGAAARIGGDVNGGKPADALDEAPNPQPEGRMVRPAAEAPKRQRSEEETLTLCRMSSRLKRRKQAQTIFINRPFSEMTEPSPRKWGTIPSEDSRRVLEDPQGESRPAPQNDDAACFSVVHMASLIKLLSVSKRPASSLYQSLGKCGQVQAKFLADRDQLPPSQLSHISRRKSGVPTSGNPHLPTHDWKVLRKATVVLNKETLAPLRECGGKYLPSHLPHDPNAAPPPSGSKLEAPPKEDDGKADDPAGSENQEDSQSLYDGRRLTVVYDPDLGDVKVTQINLHHSKAASAALLLRLAERGRSSSWSRTVTHHGKSLDYLSEATNSDFKSCSDEDTVAAALETGNSTIWLLSCYMAHTMVEQPPNDLASRSWDNWRDANAHHSVWAVQTPTAEEVLDITAYSTNYIELIKEWNVSNDCSFSDTATWTLTLSFSEHYSSLCSEGRQMGILIWLQIGLLVSERRHEEILQTIHEHKKDMPPSFNEAKRSGNCPFIRLTLISLKIWFGMRNGTHGGLSVVILKALPKPVVSVKSCQSSQETLELLLNTHFPGCTPISDTTNFSPTSMRTVTHVPIEDDIIRWAIKSFDPYKAPGPDGIIPADLQHNIDLVVPWLRNLYTACLSWSYIPTQWTKCNVIFIPKGDALHTLVVTLKNPWVWKLFTGAFNNVNPVTICQSLSRAGLVGDTVISRKALRDSLGYKTVAIADESRLRYQAITLKPYPKQEQALRFSSWSVECGFSVNPSKTELVLFSSKYRFLHFLFPCLNGEKYLGGTNVLSRTSKAITALMFVGRPLNMLGINPMNASLRQHLEKVMRSTALLITGALRKQLLRSAVPLCSTGSRRPPCKKLSVTASGSMLHSHARIMDLNRIIIPSLMRSSNILSLRARNLSFRQLIVSDDGRMVVAFSLRNWNENLLRLNDDCSILQAENIGDKKGGKLAKYYRISNRDIRIYTDSQAAIKSLTGVWRDIEHHPNLGKGMDFFMAMSWHYAQQHRNRSVLRYTILAVKRADQMLWPQMDPQRSKYLSGLQRRIWDKCQAHCLPFNDYCRSCQNEDEEETITHLLCDCPALRRLVFRRLIELLWRSNRASNIKLERLLEFINLSNWCSSSILRAPMLPHIIYPIDSSPCFQRAVPELLLKIRGSNHTCLNKQLPSLIVVEEDPASQMIQIGENHASQKFQNEEFKERERSFNLENLRNTNTFKASILALWTGESASATKHIMTTFNIQVAEENLFQSAGVVVLSSFVKGGKVQLSSIDERLLVSETRSAGSCVIIQQYTILFFTALVNAGVKSLLALNFLAKSESEDKEILRPYSYLVLSSPIENVHTLAYKGDIKVTIIFIVFPRLQRVHPRKSKSLSMTLCRTALVSCKDVSNRFSYKVQYNHFVIQHINLLPYVLAAILQHNVSV